FPFIKCTHQTQLTRKTNFIFLSFMAFAILSTAAAAPEPILDIAGKKLRSGVDYYILPVFRGMDGGLTLGSHGNDPCPLDVVQQHHEVDNGLPLTFSPVNHKKGVIRESTDLNIKFSAATICVQSTVWKIDYTNH
ncbi:unnamed protein product, partial [Ilex paraguariensis]